MCVCVRAFLQAAASSGQWDTYVRTFHGNGRCRSHRGAPASQLPPVCISPSHTGPPCDARRRRHDRIV